VGLGYF
jgi:hypothetical protein